MTEQTRLAFGTLLTSREETAYNRLKENPQFLEVCAQQAKSEEMVEELYQQFEKTYRIAIRRHYEGEVHKTNFEIKAVYLQGLRDCFKLLAFLSDQSEVQL